MSCVVCIRLGNVPVNSGASESVGGTVETAGGVQITRPQSCEPYVTCIFDDGTDSLTYGYAADPTNGPYSR